jgi:hypothetical protein
MLTAVLMERDRRKGIGFIGKDTFNYVSRLFVVFEDTRSLIRCGMQCHLELLD